MSHLDIALERLAPIFDDEEGGVVEAGAHDALVAGDDGLRIGGIAIAHDEKGVVERAVGLVHREVALMLEHRVGDDLGRDIEEALVKVREQDGGILDEVYDLVEGPLGSVRLEAGLGLDRVYLPANRLRALLGAGNDPHLLVGTRQISRARELEFAIGHEAIAARDATGDEAGVLDGNDVLAVQGHEPTYGTREGDVPAAPTLRLGPANAAHEIGEQLRQEVGRLARGLLDLRVHVLLAAFVGLAHETGDVHALAAGKALGGLRGIAGIVEGDGGGRALGAHGERLARVGKVLDHEYHAARRRIGDDFAMREARLVKGGFGSGGEVARGRVQRHGGDFLGSDLEDKLGSAHYATPSFSASAGVSRGPSCEAM